MTSECLFRLKTTAYNAKMEPTTRAFSAPVFIKEKMAHPEGLSIASQDSHHLYSILCLNLPISLHHTLSNTTEPILKMHCAKWYHAFTVRCNNTLLGICNSKQKGSSSWETAVKNTVKDSCGSCSSFKSLWIATSCITSSCIVGKYNIGSKFYFGGFIGGVTTPTAKPPNLIPHQNFRLYGIMCHLKNQLQAQHKIDFFW